jgi:hypothetical protein
MAMGFWKRLTNPKQARAEKLLALIVRSVDNEEYQNHVLQPHVWPMIEHGLACDKIPGGHGEFGSFTDPVPVNGPFGELAYLSRLRDSKGQRLFFQRTGSSEGLDHFKLIASDMSATHELWLDMYHPRRSRVAPPGFSTGNGPSHFSGFTDQTTEWPLDTALRIEALPDHMRLLYVSPRTYEPFVATCKARLKEEDS